MTLTLERSPYMPVPPPPWDDGTAPAGPDRGPGATVARRPAPPASPTPRSPGDLLTAALGQASPASALDLDEGLFDVHSYAKPASPPPRPRPIPPPASIDESQLRRQQRWVIAVTSGFGVLSVATVASWFI